MRLPIAWAAGWVSVAATLVACSGDGGGTDASTDTTNAMESGTDASADTGSSDAAADHAPIDAGQPFQALRPCNTATDYVEGSTITFDNSLMYTPECLFVRAGATVTFNGDFAAHPLVPSTRGTSGSPITMTNSGTTATFTFPNPGFYPYFCLLHGADQGAGMSGVVQVGP